MTHRRSRACCRIANNPVAKHILRPCASDSSIRDFRLEFYRQRYTLGRHHNRVGDVPATLTTEFLQQITKMWTTQPNFTGKKLKTITVPTWIVHADHDEAIKRENTLFMADRIPGAALLIQPAVSHFSLLQDPKQFNEHVLHFLRHKGQ